LRSISIDIAVAGIFPLANSAVWDIFGIKNCGAEIGLTEIGATEISPMEIGPTEISPMEIGPTEIGHTEIGHTEIGPMKIGTMEIGPTEIGPMKIGLTKIGPTEIGPTEISLTEIGLTEIGSMEIGSTEISPMEIKPFAAFLVIQPQFMAGNKITKFRLFHLCLHIAWRSIFPHHMAEVTAYYPRSAADAADIEQTEIGEIARAPMCYMARHSQGGSCRRVEGP